MGSQAVETADMGTQSAFARKPMSAQTGLEKITIAPEEGAETITPFSRGPSASEPSAPSREPMSFPGATRNTVFHDMAVGDSDFSAGETDRDELRKQRG
jgi:hypothetical protein